MSVVLLLCGRSRNKRGLKGGTQCKREREGGSEIERATGPAGRTMEREPSGSGGTELPEAAILPLFSLQCTRAAGSGAASGGGGTSRAAQWLCGRSRGGEGEQRRPSAGGALVAKARQALENRHRQILLPAPRSAARRAHLRPPLPLAAGEAAASRCAALFCDTLRARSTVRGRRGRGRRRRGPAALFRPS